jgi:ABC-type multidrug transport system ATPase subunit
MVQRVAIARALVHDPALLLADEPFAGLDARARGVLEDTLRRLNREGRTVLLASHDIEQSLALADQVLVLRRGRLALDRPARELDPPTVLREVTAS